MDLLACASIKNADNCNTSCELQNSLNHQIFERKWRSWLYREQVCPTVGHQTMNGIFARSIGSWARSYYYASLELQHVRLSAQTRPKVFCPCQCGRRACERFSVLPFLTSDQGRLPPEFKWSKRN